MDSRQRFYYGIGLFILGLLSIIFAGSYGLPQNISITIGIILAIASLFMFRPTEGRR